MKSEMQILRFYLVGRYAFIYWSVVRNTEVKKTTAYITKYCFALRALSSALRLKTKEKENISSILFIQKVKFNLQNNNWYRESSWRQLAVNSKTFFFFSFSDYRNASLLYFGWTCSSQNILNEDSIIIIYWQLATNKLPQMMENIIILRI